MRIALSESFFESSRALDRADARRVSAFLGKLVSEPEARGFHEEIVRDAHDRSVRALHVSRDLRAIGRVQGDVLALVYVGAHDRAYQWTRGRCIECRADGATVLVSVAPGGVGSQADASPDLGAAAAETPARLLGSAEELDGVLGEHGLPPVTG